MKRGISSYTGPTKGSRTRNFKPTSKAIRPIYRNRPPRRIKGGIAPGVLPELKYVDTASATYACDTTGSVTALNLIAVGDDNTTRDGRQVKIVSVQGRGLVRPNDSIINANLARVMLVWDNAANSALATIADILTASTAYSFPLVNNANRFTILSDQTFAIAEQNGATATQTFAGGPMVHEYDVYLRLNCVTQYDGTTAVIGDIQNGALLLVTIGTQAAGAGSSLDAAFRVRFADQ